MAKIDLGRIARKDASLLHMYLQMALRRTTVSKLESLYPLSRNLVQYCIL
jgi:hypothetical protein